FPFHQIFQTPKFLCSTTCFSQFITKQPLTPTFSFSTLTFINIASSQQSAKNAQKHAPQQPPAHHQKLAGKAPKSAHGILRVFSVSLY
ncbi:MAG: hypothetical protein K2L32_07680, partial [Muribaculaceae bacterium]|nr:hypothetical protein [Muribaculaceae bacterium]